MRRRAVAVLLGLVPLPAFAEGLAVRDLGTLAAEAKAVPGGRFSGRAETDRLTLLCAACESDMPTIRSLTADAATASRNARSLVLALGPRIAGP